MGDVYGEGTTGHGLDDDRPGVRNRYTVAADLDAVTEEIAARLDGVTERGYPVAGTYGPTQAMTTPVAVRCYDIGEDAAMRVAHDVAAEDGRYTSRVTLFADTEERLDELHPRVEAVMVEFGVEERGFLDRILSPFLES